jgi:hypothetical protein
MGKLKLMICISSVLFAMMSSTLASAQYWLYDGANGATQEASRPAFSEFAINGSVATPFTERVARETAFAYLHGQNNGLGPAVHYSGSWDQAGVGLEIHLKGNIRGVFLMYNRTPW